MIQPSSFHSAASVVGGSVLPSTSWPALPIGNGCQSMARPERDAAAFITLTASGTTSRPMSSPNRMPIFKPESPGSAQPTFARRQASAAMVPGATAAWAQPQPWAVPDRVGLGRRQPAVDDQRLAGDRGCAGAREEHDGGGDFLRRDEAAGRDASQHALARRSVVHPVSYTHLTLPTIYSV